MVGHPLTEIILPNTDVVTLYINGDATIRNMNAENKDI
jgi:hypothetical protein